MLEIGLHLVLVTRIRVDDIPTEHVSLVLLCYLLAAQQDVADKGLDRLIGAVEVEADDQTGYKHDDRPLHDLGPLRPVDLLQLRPRLADEAENASELISVWSSDGHAKCSWYSA